MTHLDDTSDPRDELASAYLDGVTSAAESALVEADPELRARVEAFRQVRTMIQATVPAAHRDPDGAVAAALAAVDEDPAGGLARPVGDLAAVAARRRVPSGSWRRVAGIAAAAAALLGAVALLGPGLGGDEASEDAGSGDEAFEATAGLGADGAARDSAAQKESASEDRGLSGGGAEGDPLEGRAYDDLDDLLADLQSDAPTTTSPRVVASPVYGDAPTGCQPAAATLGPDTSVVRDTWVVVDGQSLQVIVTETGGERTAYVYDPADRCALLATQPL